MTASPKIKSFKVTLLIMFKLLFFCNIFLTLCGISQSTKIDNVEIPIVIDYNFKLFEYLDQGMGARLDVFKAVSIDYILEEVNLCNLQTDFQRTAKGEWGNVPMVCDRAANCIEPFHVGGWANQTCVLYEESRFGVYKDFVCCPLNATKNYMSVENLLVTENLPKNHKYFEFKEVPTSFKLYRDSPYTALTGHNGDYVIGKEEVLSDSYRERLGKELVCGFIIGDQVKVESIEGVEDRSDIFNKVPFFCTFPDKCDNAHDIKERKPHPEWHMFCQNLVKPRTEHNGKTVCCHADDLAVDFLGFRYTHLPQLPLFLKYAPGLRSAYKCEEYSKLACVNNTDWCRSNVEDSGFPQYGQNPHVAVIGFVVPKLMLFHCGGSLISRRFVVSTTSCLLWFGYFSNVVLLGEYGIEDVMERVETEVTYLISSVDTYERSGFKLKPDEEPPTPFTIVDLALFRTEVEVALSPFIRPACLFHRPIVWPSHLNFVGFGPRTNDQHNSDFMKTITLPFMEKNHCIDSRWYPDKVENPYFNVFGVHQDHLICYGVYGNRTNAPCRYDQGGPLQLRMKSPYCSTQLLGVLSSNRLNCTTYRPSVFVNVSLFIEEIEDFVWGNYTFLDIYDEDHIMPTCSKYENLIFFQTGGNN